MADKKNPVWDKYESPYGTSYLPLDDRLGKASKFWDDQWEKSGGRSTAFTRPKPGDTVHDKEEPDVSGSYARGGPVLNTKSSKKRRPKW